VASACWTSYRIHADSCMARTVREGRYHSVKLAFLNWFEQYLLRAGLSGTEAWALLQSKLAPYRPTLPVIQMSSEERLQRLTATPNPVQPGSSTTTVSWRTDDGSVGQIWVSQDGNPEVLFAEGASGSKEARWINPGTTYEFRFYADTLRSRLLERLMVHRLVDPGVGGESFGSLRRVVPISRDFGFNRGQPIDRYYIDLFLDQHSGDLRGRVLEVGDSSYVQRLGGNRVSAIDVLHVREGGPRTTIVGDLSNGDGIPSGAFDCVLLVQTLHLIFDVSAAVRTLYRILKPEGVLLATFPGISQKSQDEWASSWYWGFTSQSAERLFGQVFQPSRTLIKTHGNVLATTAFLYGLSATELSTEELNYVDPCYETLVTVRATK